MDYILLSFNFCGKSTFIVLKNIFNRNKKRFHNISSLFDIKIKTVTSLAHHIDCQSFQLSEYELISSDILLLRKFPFLLLS